MSHYNYNDYSCGIPKRTNPNPPEIRPDMPKMYGPPKDSEARVFDFLKENNELKERVAKLELEVEILHMFMKRIVERL